MTLSHVQILLFLPVEEVMWLRNNSVPECTEYSREIHTEWQYVYSVQQRNIHRMSACILVYSREIYTKWQNVYGVQERNTHRMTACTWWTVEKYTQNHSMYMVFSREMHTEWQHVYGWILLFCFSFCLGNRQEQLWKNSSRENIWSSFYWRILILLPGFKRAMRTIRKIRQEIHIREKPSSVSWQNTLLKTNSFNGTQVTNTVRFTLLLQLNA